MSREDDGLPPKQGTKPVGLLAQNRLLLEEKAGLQSENAALLGQVEDLKKQVSDLKARDEGLVFEDAELAEIVKNSRDLRVRVGEVTMVAGTGLAVFAFIAAVIGTADIELAKVSVDAYRYQLIAKGVLGGSALAFCAGLVRAGARMTQDSMIEVRLAQLRAEAAENREAPVTTLGKLVHELADLVAKLRGP